MTPDDIDVQILMDGGTITLDKYATSGQACKL